jgi:hypothetical protein
MEIGDIGELRGLARVQAWAAQQSADREPERRHEALMESAAAAGLDRGEAEGIYELAQEVGLEPELALLLVSSGVGVVELKELDSDPEGIGIQQAPPEWVADGSVPVAEARRERRLRLSFRRLRGLLEESGSAPDALRRFANEPDVAEGAY